MARPNLVPREYLQFMLKSGGWGARLKKGQIVIHMRFRIDESTFFFELSLVIYWLIHNSSCKLHVSECGRLYNYIKNMFWLFIRLYSKSYIILHILIYIY